VTAVAACLVAITLMAASCSAHGSGKHAAAGPRAAAPADPGSPGLALQVTPAPYQLPAAISREDVLADGSRLLVLGGLTSPSASTDAVTALDPVTGATHAAARLVTATHDAAGAMLGGRAFVFGGGLATSVATVQAVTPGRVAAVAGQLPTVRSDLSAVTVGSVAYLVGGYDGTTYRPSVLATGDGLHFRTAARLPVPVRYAAVAMLGTQIWVFGGETTNGPTSAVQRIDSGTGRASVVGHLPQPVDGASAVTLGGQVYLAGGQVAAGSGAGAPAPLTTSGSVSILDPGTGRLSPAGQLPVPVAYAGAAVVGGPGARGTAYLIGGNDGHRDVPAVTTLRLVAASSVIPASAASAPWLAPASGPGHLGPGSDPSALPADVLIADHRNNRLVVVDPAGRIRWVFPRPGDLAAGQSFLVPDDAFFSPDGKYIVVTQEDNFVVSVIDVATRKIVYRYGIPGRPGPGPGLLNNPDDAMLTPAGKIVTADIKNCRIVLIRPPAHSALRVIGQTRQDCVHDPPHRFGSPNGAFPLTDGNYLVTEINGDWVDEMSLGGHVAWSANPPGVAYPSDTNEVYPGRYLTADYADSGQVVEFGTQGRPLWRLGGFNKPSLALPLPNGDILLNDDFNHRVVVVDPRTSRIVWQYGHTGIAGQAPGYLNDPDGVDLVPPDSLLVTHASTMGEP
jgi:DNA-binding beta-propeller fold protein YncE